PSRQAALVMGDGARVVLEPGDEGRGLVFETALTLARDGSYRVAVVDHDGLENPDHTEYFIRLVDDAPPEVRIVRPAGDQRVTPLAEVAVEARADDDHGIRDLEIVYAVRGGEERVVPVGPSTGRSATGRHLIYLEDLDVSPGDFVSYYARSRVDRGTQRHLLPRGEAVRRRVRGGAEHGAGRRGCSVSPVAEPGRRSEGNHRRDLEARTARGCGAVCRRPARGCRRAA